MNILSALRTALSLVQTVCGIIQPKEDRQLNMDFDTDPAFGRQPSSSENPYVDSTSRNVSPYVRRALKKARSSKAPSKFKDR